MKKVQIKVDAQSRVCLADVTKNLPSFFHAYKHEGKIILEEVPEDEAWLYEPKNKSILKSIQKGLKQKSGKKRSFLKYLKS